MCVSAGSARHHRAPYTVTMTTSKTRHLSLNRPDTHIHDTHKYKTIRRTGTQTGHMDKQTHTRSANRMQQRSPKIQTIRRENKQTQTGKTKYNRGWNQIVVLTNKHVIRCNEDRTPAL